MKRSILFGFLLLGFLLPPMLSLAQTETDTLVYLRIRTYDGNKYIGTLVEENDSMVVLKTPSVGKLQVHKSMIKYRKTVNPGNVKNGVYWVENPNYTRNVYGPTGYGLKKGEGYYQNIYLILNSVSYGITDNFTLGVGLVPFAIEGNFIFTLTPKLSFPIVENKFNVGAGLLYSRVWEESLGIAYGVATYGSKENNATLGIGYGFVNSEMANRPIITLGGMTRIGRKLGLVSENWIIPVSQGSDRDGGPTKYNYELLFSYGIRLIFESITVDIAFINNTSFIEEGLILGFPIVGIVVPFGGGD